MLQAFIMILNYDKDNGFTSIIDNFIGNGQKVIEISQEIKDAFLKLEGQSGILGASKQDAYDIAKAVGVANKSVVDFVREGKGGLKEYEAAMQSASQSTSIFTRGMSTLKTIGGTLLSTFTNMAIMWTISKGIELAVTAIDNYIHKTEKLIEAGEEAKQAISDIGDAYSTKKTTVDDNKARYVELASGVNTKTNENLSLTTDE